MAPKRAAPTITAAPPPVVETAVAAVVPASKKRKQQEPAAAADSNWKKLKQTMPIVAAAKKKPVAPVPAPASATSLPPQRMRTANMYYEHTGIVALDCEMVGDKQNKSMLARVCLVDDKAKVLYDEYVLPTGPVKDFRTKHSGILPHHLSPNRALPFQHVQAKMVQLMENKIVVGHGLKNDFDALQIDHPAHLVRDTSHYHRFTTKDGRPRKLKMLSLELLQNAIQEGRRGHDPRIDAKAALDLYLKHSAEWEQMLAKKKTSDAGKSNKETKERKKKKRKTQS